MELSNYKKPELITRVLFLLQSLTKVAKLTFPLALYATRTKIKTPQNKKYFPKHIVLYSKMCIMYKDNFVMLYLIDK